MFIVVAYYTDDEIYGPAVDRLSTSLLKYGLNHHLQIIDSKGSWSANTSFKPSFIREMMDRYPGAGIVYTDADSEFVSYPVLFDSLDCPVAIHLLDHTIYKPNRKRVELLSGTIFFNNSDKSKQIVDAWIQVCQQFPEMWDQRALHRVLGSDFHQLPPGYCQIYDYMKSVADPVVRHYQASRVARRKQFVKG